MLLIKSVVHIFTVFFVAPLDVVLPLSCRVLLHKTLDHLLSVVELVKIILENLGFLKLIHEGTTFR